MLPFLFDFRYNQIMSKKEPMSIALKSKLIIQGEYLLIGLVFLTLGILKVTDVFQTASEVRFRIFNFVTILGGTWILIDFFWSTFSKKRRAKVDYLDKVIILPASLALTTFDIYSFVTWNDGIPSFAGKAIGTIFIYIGVIYIFQAVYHWFRPTKALLAAIAEDEKAAEEKRLALEQEALEEAKQKEEIKENKDGE